jgi:HSP20 family protein
VWEAQSEVVLFVDVPGVARDHVDLQVQGGALLVTGARPAPITNGHRLRLGERPIGNFRRVIPLPPGLKLAELSARLRDGVLEVVIPRDPAAGATQPRQVPIA